MYVRDEKKKNHNKILTKNVQEVAIYEYEESLIVKCYVKTQKLIWEIIQKNCTLKKKIEIDWSDISAIRSRMVQREFAVLGVLEIEVSILIS